jgi:hypothetical protein
MRAHAGVNYGSWLRAAIAVALLVPALERGAFAQTKDDRGGFAVRELSLSTGYASVQLPPITLSGYLPNDILNTDLITSGQADIEWWRVTPRTQYAFELSGAYTARTPYSQLTQPVATWRSACRVRSGTGGDSGRMSPPRSRLG